MSLKQDLFNSIRKQGKSRNTAKIYWHWISRYCRWLKWHFGGWVHPKDAGRAECEGMLSYMAIKKNCSASTQNQALSALVYLYRHLVGKEIQGVDALRAKAIVRCREVFDQSDLMALFAELHGPNRLASLLMYGCGLRIGETHALRLKDLSFPRQQLWIRGGKGKKDRVCQFPALLHDAVRRQIESVRVLHRIDRQRGFSGVSMPDDFASKSPNAQKELRWYYLFPSEKQSRKPADPDEDKYSRSYRDRCPLLRHHRNESNVGREVKNAADRAGILRRITPHCFRHCWATHMHESGVPVRDIQALMGHNDIRTTMTYIHVDQHAATSAQSPLAAMMEQECVCDLVKDDATGAWNTTLQNAV